MLFDTNKDKGRAGLSLAIAYFGANGYSVNITLNDTQWYDLIIEKDGKFETVQCKATGSQDGSISLRSFGGTKGTCYDNVLNHSIDWLFCLNQDGLMWNIPVKDIKESGTVNAIRLRTEPNSNNQGFNTYKYLVKI